MISIILPIHNEARILIRNVTRLKKQLDDLGISYELILAEDGSTDQTPQIVKTLASSDARIRPILTKRRLGRGLSLLNTITAARSDIVVYMDADLATDLSQLPALIAEIKKGAVIATGSRLLPNSKVSNRNALRDIASRGYNLLLRFLFRTKIKDHQCGFKAFNRAATLLLLKDVRDPHWFWDSELLIRAQKAGLEVAEIPIAWVDRKQSSVRLSSDVIYMGISAVRLRLCL